MDCSKKTALYDTHVKLGAKMVDFSGWQMPVQYSKGIFAEHLATRRKAGLFDVSHMGRFYVCGEGASMFLRKVLTNNCDLLDPGQAHYSILANENGGAIDDAFLYRKPGGEFLLVVNAANAAKDWCYLQNQLGLFDDVELADVTGRIAMIALQGPAAERIVSRLVTEKTFRQARNTVGNCRICGVEVMAAGGGYTGENVCFELFVPVDSVGLIWDRLIEEGAEPAGLGARDTLRLEAGLPLYGHELGLDSQGNDIPVFAIPQAGFAVSLDPARQFVGKDELEKQAALAKAYRAGDYSDTAGLDKVVKQFCLIDKGIARRGAKIYYENKPAGVVTSGTMVPYWKMKEGAVAGDIEDESGWHEVFTGEYSQRALGLCMVLPNVRVDTLVEIESRSRRIEARIVAGNLENRRFNTCFALLYTPG